MIRAVVFDFDGVIANSEPLHFAAFRDVLDQQGVELAKNDYYDRYLGYDDVGVFRAVSGDRRLNWSDDRVAALVRRKASRLEELERHASVLFPGAEAAVRRLAQSLPLAIASGALRAEIVRVLEQAGMSECFVAVVAAEDSPVSKPAPDPYLRAVELARRGNGPVFEAGRMCRDRGLSMGLGISPHGRTAHGCSHPHLPRRPAETGRLGNRQS